MLPPPRNQQLPLSWDIQGLKFVGGGDAATCSPDAPSSADSLLTFRQRESRSANSLSTLRQRESRSADSLSRFRQWQRLYSKATEGFRDRFMHSYSSSLCPSSEATSRMTRFSHGGTETRGNERARL